MNDSASSVLIDPTNRIYIGRYAEQVQYESDGGIYTTSWASDCKPVRVSNQSSHRPRRNGLKQGAVKKIAAEERVKLKRYYASVMNAARKLEEASKEDRQRVVHIAFADLATQLDHLWELRSLKDIDWVTILNHMQSLVKQAEREDMVASLTSDQCTKIREIVEKYLSAPTKTPDDLEQAVHLVRLAGFDPFYLISDDS